MRHVEDSQLSGIFLDNSDVVSELFVGDEVVAVAVHLVEGLDDVDCIDPGSDECATDLVSLEAVKLGTLLLEDYPKWLPRVVVQHILLLTICFDSLVKEHIWLGFGFILIGSPTLLIWLATSAHFIYFDYVFITCTQRIFISIK